MDTPVSKELHEECQRRINDENNRQNARLGRLEDSIARIENLMVSIEKLAINVERISLEQERQNVRLKELESRDGEKWRDIAGHITTAIVGAVVCYIFTRVGMG